MPDDRSDTARRRFLQVLGAGTALGIGASTGVTAGEDDTGAGTDGDTDAAHGDGPYLPMDDPGLITLESDADFETTVSRVEPALEERGLQLVTTVDHAANADSVDMDLPPTTLFLFGNPAVGTPLMQASRSIGIDLPQKLLVWEADDRVRVTYNDPQYLATRHDLEDAAERSSASPASHARQDVDEQIAGASEALAGLAAAVAGAAVGDD